MAKAKVITKNVDIAALKSGKDLELTRACSNSIVNPFQSKIVLESTGKAHLFGTDIYDQTNMQQKLIMCLSDRSIIEIPWKIKNSNEVVYMTREEFVAVVKEVGDMVEKNRMKLAVLRSMLEATRTELQITAVTWNSI